MAGRSLSLEVSLRIGKLQDLQARMEKHEAAVLARMSAIDDQASAIGRELDAVEASVTAPATVATLVAGNVVPAG